MRSLRSEALALTVSLAFPVGVVMAVFPYGALFAPAADPSRDFSTTVAFVSLSDDESRLAMRTVRTVWRGSDGTAQHPPEDLFVETLPDDVTRPVMADPPRFRTLSLPDVACDRVPYLPSQGAPPPARIPSDGETLAPPAFSREELLEIK